MDVHDVAVGGPANVLIKRGKLRIPTARTYYQMQ